MQEVVESFLGKYINNGWFKVNYWHSMNLKVDNKKVKKGAKPNDIPILIYVGHYAIDLLSIS